MSENKSKNIVIIALCITLIFMGVGFSLLSQTLTINGTASVDSNSRWDVEIAEDQTNSKAAIEAVSAVFAGNTVEDLTVFNNASSVTLDSSATPKVLGKTSFTATTASFDVVLNEPGDYVIYKVRVANKGTIDAKLTSAEVSDNSKTDVEAGYVLQESEEAQKIFTFEVVDSTYASTTGAALVSGASTLTAGTGEEYIYVKVSYNDTHLKTPPTGEFASVTGTFSLIYTQNTSN